MTKIRQYVVLAALAGVGLLALGWFALVSPKRSDAAQLRSQAAAEEAQVASLGQQLKLLRAQEREMPKQRARLAELTQRIPENPALPSLVRALTDAAERAGVGLVSISPTVPSLVSAQGAVGVPGGVPSSTTTAGRTAGTRMTAPPAQLAQIGLKLEVEGSYFEVEQFMSNLESLKRALLTSGIQLRPSEPRLAGVTGPGDGGEYTGVIATTIDAQVFMTVKAPAATAAQPAAAATSAE